MASAKFITTTKHALQNAYQGLTRNKLLTAATILIIALMLFVFNLILALNVASDSVIETVGKKLDISVELQEEVEDYTVQTFIGQLNELPQVNKVLYVPKEEALQSFGTKYPNVITFLDHYQLENPLPNILRIESKDVEFNNEIIAYLEDPTFNQIVNQQKLITNLDQKDRNQKIVDVTRFVRTMSFWLSLVFALVGLLIIFNSINININHHKNEIQIMKLVGAKFNAIRSGFIVEGILFGLCGLIISLLLSRILLGYLARNIAELLTNENILSGINAILLHFGERFWLTFSWQLLATLIASALSSYLAIELYLRKEG